MSRQIQEQIGKKINKGNVYRKIPKKKERNFQEEIEGGNLERDLNQAKYDVDITLNGNFTINENN
jgi:hypothetical protein